MQKYSYTRADKNVCGTISICLFPDLLSNRFARLSSFAFCVSLDVEVAKQNNEGERISDESPMHPVWEITSGIDRSGGMCDSQ